MFHDFVLTKEKRDKMQSEKEGEQDEREMEKKRAEIAVIADSSNACGNAGEFGEGRDSRAADNIKGNAEKSGAPLYERR